MVNITSKNFEPYFCLCDRRMGLFVISKAQSLHDTAFAIAE
ncbi:MULTISPECIES: hypothetical protein [Acetomicrobium]|nr:MULTISPECIES: hypothetical protein [Acetomicrobium]